MDHESLAFMIAVLRKHFVAYCTENLTELDVTYGQLFILIAVDKKPGCAPKEIAAYLKETKLDITETKLTPENLTELIGLIEKNTISNNIGKQIIVDMLKDGTPAKEIVEKKGLSQITDTDAIKEICQRVADANPNQVTAYKNGKVQLFGFFVGQVMKETKGRANPQVVNQLLKEILG